LGDVFAECARAHGIRLLHDERLELEGLAVAGVAVDRGRKPPQYLGALDAAAGDAGLVLVGSHFPVLSEAPRLAAAGLPYPGDLVNRAELERRLRSASRPTVVLCGHIHARCSMHAGHLLQLSVGALIEPPFDATIVELDATALAVRRTARRLGEVAVTDPVFVPEEERWQRTPDGWEVEAPVAAG
jgi:hypothetical protein